MGDNISEYLENLTSYNKVSTFYMDNPTKVVYPFLYNFRWRNFYFRRKEEEE